MPLDLDGLFQEGVDVGRAESAAEIARLQAALEEAKLALDNECPDIADAIGTISRALAKEGK